MDDVVKTRNSIWMLCLQKTTFFYLIVLVERGGGVDVGAALPHLNGHSIVFNAT